ncbi:hypothetical protein AYO22_10499 [Fonsecaea multimorphosa]|nr:hypothetical protein AYO22_10499 [Fonsecaea multimorphosa]
MEQPGAKLEIVKAWAHGKQNSSKPDEDTGLSNDNNKGVREEDASNETSKLQTTEAFLLEDSGGTTTTCATSIPDTSTPKSRASSSTTNGAAPDLAQIKMRIAALMTRTERLLTKIRGQKPPTLG